MKKIILFLLMAGGAFSHSFASGYQVLLQSNRQLAMGNLGVALRPSASSVFWNPAALGFMDRSAIEAGFNLIDAEHNYWASDTRDVNGNPVLDPYTSKTSSPFGAPVHLYGVWAPEGSQFRFGIGFYTPFGSKVEWGDSWRHSDLLKELTLKAYYFQPTAAYRINDRLSVGAGLVVAFGSMNLQRTISRFGGKPDGGYYGYELDGKSDLAYGYNVGVFFKATEKLDVALNYRSKVELDVKNGDVSFDVPASLSSLFAASEFDGGLPMPSSLSIGIAFHPNNRLTLSAEGVVVGWSAYEALTLTFDKPVGSVNDEEKKISSSPRNYENTVVLKAGGEYVLNDWLQLRAGMYYDQTPVQDGYMTAETPGQDRLNYTCGIGFSPFENWQVDLSFLYVSGMEKKQSLEQLPKSPESEGGQPLVDTYPTGTFRSTGYVGGLTVSYKF
ncbi:MAG: outer membrane protein transport protein [Cytophagales bacterium]|nr:outer membrane protein transport protein [Cytophagales bacterium]